MLTLVVQDSGVGITAQRTDGFGLHSVRERIALAGEGASFEIEAVATGGTVARITLPLQQASA